MTARPKGFNGPKVPGAGVATPEMVLEALRKCKTGMTRDAIAASINCAKNGVIEATRAMRAAGTIQMFTGGVSTQSFYCLSEDIEQAKAAQAGKKSAAEAKTREASLERKRQRRAAWMRARRAAGFESDAAYQAHLQSEIEAPIIQRIVPAHLAEPLRPRGPSSVWGLAA